MDKRYDSELFTKNIEKEVKRQTSKLNFPKVFSKAINNGVTKREQYEKLEYKKFDEDFIANLETFIPSLDRITRDLRSAIKYETEILPVEKTRRTTPESIRHLMQNTRYIREVDEDGIIPDRILNNLSEIEYGIYENRFIMTLINRLNDYLQNRLSVIKDNMHGFRELNFNLKNKFKMNNSNISLEVKIKSQEEMDLNQIDEHNFRVTNRIEETYKKVSRMKYSNFMKIMQRYKPVSAPIMKTQVILKNPDFRNAYLLWLYLDRLHALEFTLESKRIKKDFSEDYLEQIDQSFLVLFSTIFNNSNIGRSKQLNEKSELVSIKSTKEEIDYTTNATIEIPSYDLEPQLATEYYLIKAKELFDEQFQEIRKTKGYQTSLKQILLDQYSIADQVYNHYFEAEQDQDVFEMLINYNDPIKKYEEATHKYNVTKAARQVKERLYSNSLSLENKWRRLLLKHHQEAIDSLMEKGFKETDEKIAYLDKTLQKELMKYEQEVNQRSKKRLLNRRTKLNQEIRKLKRKYDSDLKAFQIKERKRISEAKKALNAKRLLERKKIREAASKTNKSNDKELNKELTKEKKKIRNELTAQKKKIRSETNKSIKKL